MAFNNYFLDVIKYKYAEFNGRASRSEFWFFTLFKWLILIFISQLLPGGGEDTVLYKIGFGVFAIVYLGLVLPSLALSVRRLHDSGNSGWLLLINIIPILGSIILFVFYVSNSNVGPNKYGDNPHENIGKIEKIEDHLIK